MDEVNTPAWPAVSRRKPVVTYTLAAICAAVYLLEMLMGADSNTFILALMGAKVNPWIAAGEYWRLLSPVFLHGGLDHLAFNLYALVVWGRVCLLYTSFKGPNGKRGPGVAGPSCGTCLLYTSRCV